MNPRQRELLDAVRPRVAEVASERGCGIALGFAVSAEPVIRWHRWFDDSGRPHLDVTLPDYLDDAPPAAIVDTVDAVALRCASTDPFALPQSMALFVSDPAFAVRRRQQYLSRHVHWRRPSGVLPVARELLGDYRLDVGDVAFMWSPSSVVAASRVMRVVGVPERLSSADADTVSYAMWCGAVRCIRGWPPSAPDDVRRAMAEHPSSVAAAEELERLGVGV